MKVRLLLFLLVFSFVFSGSAFAEEAGNNLNPSAGTEAVPDNEVTLELSAEAAVLVDAESGKVLYAKDMHRQMYPASTTKILTSLVLLDYFKPDTLLKVGNEIAYVPSDSSKAGHVMGESITVENVIKGLIIPSGNDTAMVVAAAVAKKEAEDDSLEYTRSEEIFAGLMNEKAARLGARNTHFVNPHGYHNSEHYTSAYDIALFSQEAMKNELIAEIAAQTAFYGNGAENTLEEDSDLISQTYSWNTHNLLISPGGQYYYPYAKGIKTGFTDEAGNCLAAYAEKDDVKLIAVVLKDSEPGRWTDATRLFNYGFDNYSYEFIQDSGDIVAEAPLSGQDPFGSDVVEGYARQDKQLLLSDSELKAITKETELNNDLTIIKNDKYYIKAPVAQGEEIGKVKYLLKGEVIFEDTLYAASDIEKSNIFKDLGFLLKNIPNNMNNAKGIVPVVVFIVIGLLIYYFNFYRKRRISKRRAALRRRR